MKIYLYALLICVLSLSLSSCSSRLFETVRSLDELKMLDNIDHVEVYGSNKNEKGEWDDYLIKTVDDPKKVDLIVEAFKAQADNWQVGRYTPYLPGRLTVIFDDGKEAKESIMIVSYSSKDATGKQLYYFLSDPFGPAKPIKETEFKELIGLLEVNEDQAYYGSLGIPPESP